MIDHISLGVTNVLTAKSFYDALLDTLSAKCLYADETSLGYGIDGIQLWILAGKSTGAAARDSGVHVCFKAPNEAAIAAFHAAALEHGGTSNGGPGRRPEYNEGYTAAFVSDPDGNRLEAYFQA